MKKYIFGIIAVLIVTACKKENFELPEESSETPIFEVKGKIGDETINIVAGVDGAYQETAIQVLNGIDFFTGTMIKGTEQLTLSISDGEIGLVPAVSEMISNSLSVAYSANTSWFSVSHQSLPNAQQIQSVNFSIDGFSLGSQVSILSPGFHTVCADIVFTDGTSRSVCNKLLFGYKDRGGFLVKHYTQTGGNTTLWVEPSEVAVSSVKWYINDQFFSDSQQAVLNSTTGVVSAKAVVTFSNGLVREHTVVVDTEGGNRTFADMQSFKTNVSNEFYNDFKLSLAFQNETGLFASYASPEAPGNFVIDAVSLFKEKSNGNKIYKVSGTINTQIMNVLTEELLPSQLNMVFAVELPY